MCRGPRPFAWFSLDRDPPVCGSRVETPAPTRWEQDSILTCIRTWSVLWAGTDAWPHGQTEINKLTLPGVVPRAVHLCLPCKPPPTLFSVAGRAGCACVDVKQIPTGVCLARSAP